MDPEDIQALRDEGYSEEEIQQFMAEIQGATAGEAPTGQYDSALSGGLTGPFQAEGSGVPQWKMQEYILAHQQYSDAVSELNDYRPNLGGDPDNSRLSVLKDRATKALSNLNSVRSSMNDFIPKGSQDPEMAALDKRLKLAQVAAAERGPQAPQRAPRFPDEIERAQLENQILQQKLLDTYTLAQQQHSGAIKTIQEQLANGQIDMPEANRLIGLSRQNMTAALKGTTPWMMETKKREVASGVMDQRGQLTNSIGQGLLSGMMDAYSKILPGHGAPPMPDPFAMAQGYADQTQGGPELGQMARAVLMGALEPPEQNQQGAW